MSAHHIDGEFQLAGPPFYRVASATGGALLDPTACATLPGLNLLQPLFPETRKRKRCKSSSMQSPIVLLATFELGSI
jgi:hypothetical protein